MSTWTEVVTYIKTQLRPGVLDNTNVQKILNSVLAVIHQINAGDFTPSSDFVWNPEVSYSATIQPVLWQDQWLVSNIGANLGNVPISTSGVLHPSWRIIGSSAGSGIRIWEPIVYPNSLEVVYESGQLYYLNRGQVGVDPFVSVNFALELSEGKWVAFLEISEHNQLEGIQGGIEGERYHLTLEEKNAIGAGGNAFKSRFVRTQTGFFDPNITDMIPVSIFQTPFSWLASYFSVGTVIEIDLAGTFTDPNGDILFNLIIGQSSYFDLAVYSGGTPNTSIRLQYKITISESNEIKIVSTATLSNGFTISGFQSVTKNMNDNLDIYIRARFVGVPANSNDENSVKSNLIEVKVY